ncbi:hypothetical protein PR048_010831 [Dryococelus australis]|uniref:BESS domain-containing protein n=1 Tax=Dryococelus australis TaxID=614101 RepID=A0ABQ9I3S8_9NEOP|nr:hypothetical protein PR048_010831 [Dryococelus australis]
MVKLPRSKCGKRKGDHEEDENAFYVHMKEQYLKKSQSKEDQDGDYMFMVSLVPELKEVPQDRRLKVKYSIINLLMMLNNITPCQVPTQVLVLCSRPFLRQEFMALTVMEDVSRHSIRWDRAKRDN